MDYNKRVFDVKLKLYSDEYIPRDVFHITPDGDKYPHRFITDCICKPEVRDYGSYIVIIHNAFDHREFTEYYLKDCVNKKYYA